MRIFTIELFYHAVIVASAAIICSSPVFAQSLYEPPEFLHESGRKAKIMVLGVFHFKEKKLDSYKSEYDIDIFSKQRQAEVQEVIRLLSKFNPTKIAIEVKIHKQKYIDSLYSEWLADNYELKSNEVYQLGFRLARDLDHEKIYSVDVDGRSYEPDMTPGTIR